MAQALSPFAERRRPVGVLVVEDDSLVKEMAVRMLARAGYRVFAADSEQCALWVWQRHGPEIDLVFADVMLPERSTGPQLGRQFRQFKPDLRLVYSSGFGPEMADPEEPLETGVNFLPKPYTASQLVNIVTGALAWPEQVFQSRAEIARSVA